MNAEETVMPFGKHRGQTLGDILAEDPRYLLWLREEGDIHSSGLRDAVEEMNEKYEREINPDVD